MVFYVKYPSYYFHVFGITVNFYSVFFYVTKVLTKSIV